MRDLRIGLSLPVSYLGGGSNLTDNVWYEMFGPVQECFKLLKKHGINSIEINDLHSNPLISEIEPAIRNIVRNGFKLSVHIFLPYFTKNNELPIVFRELINVSKKIGMHTFDIPWIVHGHKHESTISTEDIISHTINDLELLHSRVRMEGLKNSIALEICRVKKGGPVGVNYQEIVYMVDRVEGSNVGICWDMGHTLYNIAAKGWENTFPPKRFLFNVMHVHIHDLDNNNRTHGPILCNNQLLNDFIKLLQDKNYQGIYNFELYPRRWEGSFSDRKNKIISSIDRLRKILIK
ncbi:MAG: sugar phosphate isomerase/epimerase family protein [bacterium]